MVETMISPRKAAYSWLHRHEPNYGHTNHGRNALDFAAGCKSILDIGGGYTPFAFWCLRDHDMERAAILDISNEPASTHRGTGVEFWEGDAAKHLDLFGTDEFELLTAFDVLEHLPAQDLLVVLQEMRRVAAKRIIVSVGTGSSEKMVDGMKMELHLTIQPLEWWKNQLAAKFGNCRIEYRMPYYYLVSELGGTIRTSEGGPHGTEEETPGDGSND